MLCNVLPQRSHLESLKEITSNFEFARIKDANWFYIVSFVWIVLTCKVQSIYCYQELLFCRGKIRIQRFV